MSNPAPSPPQKVKAFLAAVKARLEQVQQRPARDGAPWLVAAVLQLELLQRGVPVAEEPPPSSDGDIDDATLLALLGAVLDRVQAAAGKRLWEDPGPPHSALLAGASVLQARVAELLARNAATAGDREAAARATTKEEKGNRNWGRPGPPRPPSSSSPHLLPAAMASRASAVEERCREVLDTRFRCLLRLTRTTPSGEGTGVTSAWFTVAEGCYYRAATLVDNPPVWKGAWDAAAARHDLLLRESVAKDDAVPVPWEATHAVENLHRIAAFKNNAKRQFELSAALVESGLHYVYYKLGSATAVGTTSPAESTEAAQAFVAPLRPLEPPDPASCMERCRHHLDLLLGASALSSSSGEELPPWLRVVGPLFDVQWTLADHRLRIQQAAEARAAAADRRRNSGPPKGLARAASSSNHDPFLEAARRDHWRGLAAEEEDMLDQRVQRLLNRVLLSDDPPLPTAPDSTDGAAAADCHSYHRYYWRAAECVVSDYLTDWVLERARARATAGSDEVAVSRRQAEEEWRRATRSSGRIVAALLQRWRKVGAAGHRGWARDPALPILTHRLLCAVPLLEWIHSSSGAMEFAATSGEADRRGDGALFAMDLLVLVRDWQHELLSQHVAAEAAASSESKSLGSSSATDRAPWTRMQWAHRATQAWLSLWHPGVDASSGVGATGQPSADRGGNDPLSPTYDADFGTSVLEFALAWSGLHRLPWSHCTTAEARLSVSLARDCLRAAEDSWGRPISPAEEWLLDVGRADAEAASSASGGLLAEARRLYTQVLSDTDAKKATSTSQGLQELLQSKCYYGLANVALHSNHDGPALSTGSNKPFTPEDLARRNMDLLASMDVNQCTTSFYLWTSPESSIQFQMAQARQQVADCLLRTGRTNEAQTFLEDAVRHSPDDPGAALALGAFRLHLAFFGQNRSPEASKAAQVQLLKAAKLDSGRSSPFALLGYWYEYAKDRKRALGCYSKALLLDSWHPVAGRGLLRLKPAQEILPLLEKATDSGSPMNGWAWRALGTQKTMVDGNDALAVVSFLQALRSHDIVSPGLDPYSAFFASPFSPQDPGSCEFVETSADLAASYRRLGRFTASLRSYYAALDAAGDETSGGLLNACAHVEMELGLFSDASEKLSQAMEVADSHNHSVAAYSLSICLFSMAKRDAQDGKAGLAYDYLSRAAECCHQLADQSGCVQKLIGDIHSYGAFLPPDVFGNQYSVDEGDAKTREEDIVKIQVAFVAAGLNAYRAAEEAIQGSTSEESQVLRACAVTDAGSNLLLQAQLVSVWESKGILDFSSPEATELCRQAEGEFRRAIDLNPLYPSAWCGLGCAVYKSDPLLAQHAFCRSIELDPLYPEPYSNLSFLYTRNGALKPSCSVSDALTQVADTPMMWINRAFVMERQNNQKGILQQAADAYRAALQVAPIPTAKYGLALAGRSGNAANQELSIMETNCLLSEYLDATGRLDLSSRLFSGVSSIESGVVLYPESFNRMKILSGQLAISQGLQELDLLDCRNVKIPLDVEAFDAIQVPLDEVSTDNVQFKVTAGALKRQLIHEPHRGDLWLSLSKELVRGGERNVPGLVAASLAADKASRILLSNSAAVRTRPDQQQLYVPVHDLADAWSLRYWLDSILSESHQDERNRAPTTIGLQRALFLCPNHSLAREALRHVTN